MKVQTLSRTLPQTRRPRSELYKFVVKWIDGDTMYFQWFKRDAAACRFQQELVEQGFQTRLLMK